MICSDMIGYEIRTLDNLLFRMMLAYSAREGLDQLTMMHGWIIGYLYDNRRTEIYQKDLEKKFSISRSTVTSILKRMESKGYIVREGVPGDARLKKLVLTEEGVRLHVKNDALIACMDAELKGTMEQEEMEQFITTARKMKRNMRRILCQMGVRINDEEHDKTERSECSGDKDISSTD